MAASFETTFQQWAEKHRDEEPDDEECARLQDEFVACQERSDGFLARFESILETWEKNIPRSEAYQALKTSVEQRAPSARSIVTSLSWKDLDFAAHVVRRYLQTAEGQGKNVTANGRWLKCLAQVSIAIDEATFVLVANHAMFPRHKEGFEDRAFSKSLRHQPASFLLVKEMTDIASKARKAKNDRAKILPPASSEVMDQMFAWVQKGLVKSPSGNTRTLKELAPTGYAAWMLDFDNYGLLVADTRDHRTELPPTTLPPTTPINALQSPPPSSPGPTLLPSPSVTCPQPEVHQTPSHSSASSLTDGSLDGSPIAASEPPKEIWDPDVSDEVTMTGFAYRSEPSAVELTVSDGSPADSSRRDMPAGARGAGLQRSSSSEVHAQQKEPAVQNLVSILCDRLARKMMSKIVSDILGNWEQEASMPGASPLWRQRSECVAGSWAQRVPPEWHSQSGPNESSVVQCTPGQMLHLARTRQAFSDVYSIRPSVASNGDRNGLGQFDPVDPSVIYELETLGGIPGKDAASVAMDVADAPEWPLAACMESRFTALPHISSASSYVGHGLKGTFREPVAYDLCGIWYRLVLGNAILSVQSRADQEWGKIYMRSGETAYLSPRKMHAMTFVTDCTICEYVTVDVVDLVQELENMQATPRSSIILPYPIQTRMPWLEKVLADPRNLANFIDKARTGSCVEAILDELGRESYDQMVSSGL